MNIISRVSQQVTNGLFTRLRIKSTETRNIHSLCNKLITRIGENVQQNVAYPGSMLQSKSPILHQFYGMKYKVALRLRCKGCYFVTSNGVRYVRCKLKGRHKQSAIVPKPKALWIWTHMSQSKRREW